MTVSQTLRVGVDVGGTNTDAAILDVSPGAVTPVLASFKASTTSNVTLGIQNAIVGCLDQCHVDKSRIQAVSIGTTSFVNSLIEKDATKLARVGVIRLCGPFSRMTPPFTGFPNDLREVLEGPAFFAAGGLHVDGRQLAEVDPAEVRAICAELRAAGITAVAISGCYSPIDREIRQEELVRAIVLAEMPGVHITLCKEIANLGLLSRENAAILNSALLPFAAVTVAGFQDSARALDLSCPVFLTSNDGMLMSCAEAAKYPIKTFSSGPTNSMRGANFLANLATGTARREAALVLDVGGTTTEIGVLLPTGFPRQAGAQHEFCGVQLNFSMPHVLSIGLGGGSRIRQDGAGVSVGPDSVGYRIDQALSFGGQTLVATDVAVAMGWADHVGDKSLVSHLDKNLLSAVQDRIKVMLELAIDSMKTNNQDIPVYLVGGGAILVPNELKGVSQVHRFPFYDAANAVGAAVAQVAGIVDTFEDTSSVSPAVVQRQVEERAIAKAVAAGADPAKTAVVESECIPIAYSTGRCRFYVKAAGEWTGESQGGDEVDEATSTLSWDKTAPLPAVSPVERLPMSVEAPWTPSDILAYRPKIVNKEWLLSEIDLKWIAAGCYILGCGGGGSPQGVHLAIARLVRQGATIRVVDFAQMDADATACWGGGIGSPEVSSELLNSGEYNEAVSELLEFTGTTNCRYLIALEIGGGNGMVNMLAGASTYLDMPVIDGDFMGRAYPTGWQVTPNVYDAGDVGANLLPCAMSSGDGNVVFMTKARHYKEIDGILRAACVEMGTRAGTALRPLTKAQCDRALIRNTVSQAWRLGRAVELAARQANIGNIGPVLVDALGGDAAACVLFAGKIVDVARKIVKGHSYGEVVVQALAAEDADDGPKFEGSAKVPFKNENLYCEVTAGGSSKIVAGVPDLIAVIDAQSGAALGTPDFKYGLRVLIVCVTAAPQWTDTPRGLALGALPAFGFDAPYEPIGKYAEPRSVIEEYS
ncbi:hypothetical protein Q5752_000176 [Cryptotrichosporon argae]